MHQTIGSFFLADRNIILKSILAILLCACHDVYGGCSRVVANTQQTGRGGAACMTVKMTTSCVTVVRKIPRTCHRAFSACCKFALRNSLNDGKICESKVGDG